MQEYWDATAIANSIRMDQKENRACLLVEGYSDEKLYQKFLAENCQIEICNGKDNVIGALSILATDKDVRGVLAIVDADFMHLEGKAPSLPNLLLTDSHDLETMILQSSALKNVLKEFGSAEKMAHFVEKSGKDVRLVLLECASHVGYLRWLSLRENLSLRFEGLKFDRKIVTDELIMDVDALIRRVQSQSNKQICTDKDISSRLCELRDSSHDLWLVCCGHDLIQILAFGLRRILGTTNEISSERLEVDLRLAYEQPQFCKTQLYASIKLWEEQNAPFSVLRIESSSLN